MDQEKPMTKEEVAAFIEAQSWSAEKKRDVWLAYQMLMDLKSDASGSKRTWRLINGLRGFLRSEGLRV